MSKKFFTKKRMEYIESVIYTITIMIVIFANTYGPVYIKMFPLLLILGIVGKVIFGRPIITSLFGTVVSICFIYLRDNRGISIIENIILSASAGISIALGEILGHSIEIISKRLKNKRTVSNKRFRHYIILSAALIVFSIIIHDYINGNIFTYIKCEKKLKEYLALNYGNTVEFNIVSSKYNFLGEQSYVLRIKNSEYNQINRFVIYINDTANIQDGYKSSIIAKDNVKLKQYFAKYISDNEIIEENTNITAEYTDLNNIEIKIERTSSNLGENDIYSFSSQVNEIIGKLNNLKYYNNVKQIYISINNSQDKKDGLSSIIDLTKYKEYLTKNPDNSVKYIEDSLSFEYIEEAI